MNKETFQTIYYLAGTVAALGTLIAAMLALRVYRANSRLERSRWAASLYERFYHEDNLKQIRDTLDCPADSDLLNQLVIKEDPRFTNYLNFFEFISFLKDSKQLQDSEDSLFGYYLACLRRHDRVKAYILNKDNGYEGVARLIGRPQ